jgi:prephenate dehydrogenase
MLETPPCRTARLSHSILPSGRRVRQSAADCYNRSFQHLPAKASMPHWKRVTIIGVGLIGGSIGLALRRRRLAETVVGVGPRQATLDVALELGAIDEADLSLQSAASDAQLVLACSPVQYIAPQLIEAAKACSEHALLTDVGSTKHEIVQTLQSLPSSVRFCGSHPLAGSEKSGPSHADERLFEGRTVVLTPVAETDPSAVEELTDFWSQLGGQVVIREPADHDRALAATSHLPHVVAAALAAATDESDLPLSATGWRDTTRIAGGDVELWRQILAENRHCLGPAFDRFESILSQFRIAIENDDQNKLADLLEQGKRNRDALGS